MHPGEMIALYSDGITEATNGKNSEYGEERLIELLKKNRRSDANTILQTVFKDVENYSGIPQDDVTLMVVKRV